LFVSGALLIGFSAFLGYKLVYHFTFVPSECIAPFILLFLFAIIHVLLTWLGVKGPTKEHLFHVVLFVLITVVAIGCEIAIGIWSMVLWSKVADQSARLMSSSFQGFVKDNYDKNQWTRLQTELQCCGINNVSDYSTIGSPSGSIPISCCNTSTTACLSMYAQGCKAPLIKYVKTLMLDIALIGFGSGLFQVVGILAFYYFYKAVKQELAATQTAARRASRIEANPLTRQNSRIQGRSSVSRQNSGTAA